MIILGELIKIRGSDNYSDKYRACNMIDNYLSTDVQLLLDRLSNSSHRDWLQRFILILKDLYPTADHWTTTDYDKSYVHILVGKKELDKANGSKIFRLFISGNKPSCILGKSIKKSIKDQIGNDHLIFDTATPDNSFSNDQIKDWLHKYDLLIPEINKLSLYGHSYSPLDYEIAKNGILPLNDSITNTTKNNPIMNLLPLNQILYGPPGTGKTFSTINEALRILDKKFYELNKTSREALKKRFDELVNDRKIRFTTFHQSFSYEDFVEGLRAETDDANPTAIKYSVQKGVFRSICDEASNHILTNTSDVPVNANPRIWKISIQGTGPSKVRDYCFKNGEARIGWSQVGNIKTANLNSPEFNLGPNDKLTLDEFANEIAVGDVFLCIANNTEVAGIGVVKGEYRYDANPAQDFNVHYKNVLPVSWLATDLNFSILELNQQRNFTQKTIYEITRFSWKELLESLLNKGINLAGIKSTETNTSPYVIIIDEINRGNISKIFGELITLIEPSKRIDAEEALTVTLPYSKKPFGIPSNVYIIGTMNTADRSLTGLDIALRRRFTFKEMPAKPDLLDDVLVEGINIGQLLRIMNQRIEVLIGRDHCIGHAYFMPLKTDNSLAKLSDIFKRQIMPLLQEYFFDDYEKISWVLNDGSLNAPRFINQGGETALNQLFPSHILDKIKDSRWSVNDSAFKSKASYQSILGDSN